MSAFQGVPKVAIIGGGISGLSCARRLQSLGIDSTVFDTGKKATGGRCSSRNLQVDGQTHVTDHSSQFFTASSERFKKDLEPFRRDGSIIEWNGNIVQISDAKTQKVVEINPERPRYVGKNGMGSFSRKLSEDLDIKRPIWVSKMERCKINPDKWKLYQYNDFLGYFDIVVIAHNGKCADRLLSTAVFAVKGSLPVSFEGAYVSGSKTLSWMGNNTKKMRPSAVSATAAAAAAPYIDSSAFPAASVGPGPGPKAETQELVPKKFSYATAASKALPPATTPIASTNIQRQVVSAKGSDAGAGAGVECWTLTSTREFGAANKVPQENVPPEKEREIASLMLRAMEGAAGLPSGSIVPVACKVQLWGAAVPMNRYSAPFIMDGEEGLAVCGDWFTPGAASSSSGPSIESAYLSGSLLADAVADRLKGGVKRDHGLELQHCFQHFNLMPGTVREKDREPKIGYILSISIYFFDGRLLSAHLIEGAVQ